MPRSFNQKIKILYIMKFFIEKTDRNHSVKAQEILDYLGRVGVPAERKTIYSDIETLQMFGMNIVNRRGKNGGFYLEKHMFEPEELRCLIEQVQADKFLSPEKARKLIKKLEQFSSVYEAKVLRRCAYVQDCVKWNCDQFYENANLIQQAMSEDRQISFQYIQWTLKKESCLCKNGERSFVSPWGMIRRSDNYYLIAVDANSGILRCFRVDRIQNLIIENIKRNGKEMFRELNPVELGIRTFHVLGGKTEFVQLKLEKRLSERIMDDFGQEITIYPYDEIHVKITISVNPDERFFGWLTGLGSAAEILSPVHVRQKYCRFLQNICKNYKNSKDGRRI